MSKKSEDKVIAAKLDFNDLKAVCRDLNATVDKYNETVEEDQAVDKIRIVGLKKVLMFEQWVDTVHTLFDAEFDDLPSSVVEYYNQFVNPDEPEDEHSDEPEDEHSDEPEDEPEPKKAKAKKKDSLADRPAKPVGRAKITDFETLKAALKNPQRPTAYFDKLCLKGGTVEDVLAKFKQYLADGEIDFSSLNTISAVNSHIKYRQEKGYLYEQEDGKIKLIGFDAS